MPSITPLSHPDVLYNVGQSIMESLVTYLSSEANLDIPDRRYVGFADPPEECCPDLVMWATMPRLNDGGNFDSGFREGRMLCAGLWTIDYHIRYGVCWTEPAKGLSVPKIEEKSRELYQIGYGLMKWICALPSGIVPELQSVDTDFRPGTLTPYKLGGCAGWETLVTVGLL